MSICIVKSYFMKNDQENIVLLTIDGENEKYSCTPVIASAISEAELEISRLDETLASVSRLKPECDKLDYILSACSGALCGIVDVFMVGAPSDSQLGNITDSWFSDRTCDFARLCGWKGNEDNQLKSAVSYLERNFDIPYDQRGCGDAGADVFGLNLSNHHFKSLGHNPSILGLVFSVIDQFTNRSHFITDGDMVILNDADNNFTLHGNTFFSKLWCGIVNWLGHLMSDVSGSSGSIHRGAGIPSPLWTWVNDVVAVKRMLNIEPAQFDKDLLDMSLQLYNKGFDLRFQTAQVIPVIINELLVRLIFLIRRLLKYYASHDKDSRTWKEVWNECKPFSNVTVKRMLSVAHGTFCLVDAGDAAIRGFSTGGGSFNAVEFFLRLNVAGLGRFGICLFGETKRAINYHKAECKAVFAGKERNITEFYLEGLKKLAVVYDDGRYLDFMDDLKNNLYEQSFEKTACLAKLRGVDSLKIMKSKKDIDSYFNN